MSVKKSWKIYQQNLEHLGSGSSTLSKNPQYPDTEPALIACGKGCRVWDEDGNEYIDFRNALGPVSLGYCIPEIDNAIINQLQKGIIYGHPHRLEGETAELFTSLVPCAEKVRFLKTGGEAVAACIKIARAATGRDKIVQSGYNGWLNLMSMAINVPAGIAKGKPLLGIPEQIAALHCQLPWGDEEAWEQFFRERGNETAAVVIAANYEEIEKGHTFLPFVRELSRKYGTLMIMDEIVTGFRVAVGGTHEYFGIDPDMAVFAKGLANGMPLSAYAGKKDLIDLSAKISISSTYGGETLSLAAANEVMKFYKENNVIEHIWSMSELLWENVKKMVAERNMDITISGFPVCPRLGFGSGETADNFYRNCYSNGVALYGVSYVNFSHKEKDIHEALSKIELALDAM